MLDICLIYVLNEKNNSCREIEDFFVGTHLCNHCVILVILRFARATGFIWPYAGYTSRIRGRQNLKLQKSMSVRVCLMFRK